MGFPTSVVNNVMTTPFMFSSNLLFDVIGRSAFTFNTTVDISDILQASVSTGRRLLANTACDELANGVSNTCNEVCALLTYFALANS